MEERRQSRIPKLAPEIARKRRKVSAMKISQSVWPPYVRERFTKQLQELTEELQKMEAELHQLNVEQIRGERKASQSNS